MEKIKKVQFNDGEIEKWANVIEMLEESYEELTVPESFPNKQIAIKFIHQYNDIAGRFDEIVWVKFKDGTEICT